MVMGPEYEAVRQHGCQQPFNEYQALAVGTTLISGISTNLLIPMTKAHPHIMLPWLVANDLICLVFMTAAVETKTTDPAIPAIRQKLDKAVEKVKVNVKLGEIYQGFCCICDMNVPRRTKHCSECNKCVEEFDHHCHFLNTCIGKQNHLPFLTTLSTGLLYLVSSVTMNATAMIFEFLKDQSDPMIIPVWLWAALNVLFSLLMFVPIAFLARIMSWQIRAMMQGLTQYEWFKKASKARRAEEGVEEEEEDDEEWPEDAVEAEEDEDDIPEIIIEEEEKKPIQVDYSWLLRKPLES